MYNRNELELQALGNMVYKNNDVCQNKNKGKYCIEI